MFKELFEFGQNLDREGKLPPISYYDYGEPITWVLHIWRDEPGKFEISKQEINKKYRPFSGRTNNAQAHLACDEAAYVFGKGAGSNSKHRKFRLLLRTAEHYARKTDADLAKSIRSVRTVLILNNIHQHRLWGAIKPKEWVSIQIEDAGQQHLVDHPLVQHIWHRTIKRQCLVEDRAAWPPSNIVGTCGLTNKRSPLVHRISLKVKLWKPTPIHSLNADAFVSGITGKGKLADTAHIGQSFEAGDLIARTLNYLRNQPLHHKILAKAIEKGELKTDSPKNLFAFYWIEQPKTVKLVMSVSAEDILTKLSQLFGEGAGEENDSAEKEEGKGKQKSKAKIKPPSDLSQLEALLNVPWTGQEPSLRLDENGFCLLMLSPNTGRISVREWFKVGLVRLKTNLKDFLDAQRIEAPDGGAQRCFTIQDMLRVLEESNISQHKQLKELASPNMTRALLRCAYLGEAPPTGLLEPAVICFRHPKVLKRHEQKNDRERFALLQHQLAAVMKLILTHSKSEIRMNENAQMTLETRSPAFLSGGLLAALEEAQLAAMNWKINTTLIDQFYSTAATAPCSVLGMLISRVTSQHMPKLRKNMRWKYDKLEHLLETFQTEIDNKRGFPKTLTLKQQAEFSLGFYTQRAAFSRERPPKKTQQPIEQSETRQGATA